MEEKKTKGAQAMDDDALDNVSGGDESPILPICPELLACKHKWGKVKRNKIMPLLKYRECKKCGQTKNVLW